VPRTSPAEARYVNAYVNAFNGLDARLLLRSNINPKQQASQDDQILDLFQQRLHPAVR